jgi:EpsI family protein
MRFGPGYEHVTFGRFFFVVVMLAMFWAGRRWHDGPVPVDAVFGARANVRIRPTKPWVIAAAVLAIIVLAATFPSWSTQKATDALSGQAQLTRLPAGTQGWAGPIPGRVGWKPQYNGALVERGGVYRDETGGQVDVYVAVYGIGRRQGAELISFGNVLFPEEHVSLAVDAQEKVQLPDGGSLNVRAVTVPAEVGYRLVWTWYMVGDRALTSQLAVKALEALSFISLHAHSERIITLSTSLDAGADARLSAFVSAHAECIAAGFDGRDCGG